MQADLVLVSLKFMAVSIFLVKDSHFLVVNRKKHTVEIFYFILSATIWWLLGDQGKSKNWFQDLVQRFLPLVKNFLIILHHFEYN